MFCEVSLDIWTHFLCYETAAQINCNRYQTTAVRHKGASYTFPSHLSNLQEVSVWYLKYGFWCSIPLRLSVQSAVSDRTKWLQHVFAIGMHIIILASMFTVILKVNLVLHTSTSRPAALVLVSAPLIVARLWRKHNINMNEFIRENQFSSVPTLPHQPQPRQPSSTQAQTQKASPNYTVFTFNWELWDGSKELRISLKE